jgi:glutamyl-tRNA synthetase
VSASLPAGIDEAGWDAIRPNLSTIAEAADWWAIVTGPITAPAFDDETRAFLASAAEVAAGLDWAEAPWAALTGALKEATGRKGKTLFLPLRQAITGMEHGPDMGALLPLIGKDQVVERLKVKREMRGPSPSRTLWCLRCA